MSLTHIANSGISAALICEDPVLSRLLEIELERCGVRIAEDADAVLYLWDLDGVDFDPASLPDGGHLICWSFSSPEAFPFLADMAGRAYFLHRPFPLEALEACILSFADSVPQKGKHMLPLSSAVQAKAYAFSNPRWMLTENGVRCQDVDIPLTPRERALFRCLWEHRGELVSKAVLREALEAAENDNTTANTLEVYIYHLRQKIEKPMARRLITTERGKGYRWEK